MSNHFFAIDFFVVLPVKPFVLANVVTSPIRLSEAMYQFCNISKYESICVCLIHYFIPGRASRKLSKES